MLSLFLQAAAVVAAPNPGYPDTFSPAFATELAKNRVSDRASGLPSVTVSMGVMLQLEIAARDVCLDADKERMWEIAMRLTQDEKFLMGSLCMVYLDGAKAAIQAVRENR